jgi:hypothetical protein
MTSDNDVLTPSALTLPSIPKASQLTSAPAGYFGLSGATLVFFNGSAWQKVTSATA